MFLGAVLDAQQMAAVTDLMNAKSMGKHPTFYGSMPREAVHKQFPAIISPQMLGAAEVFAECNHPIYSEIATECAQRLPLSVMKNMVAGTSV